MSSTATELTELPSLDHQHPCETLLRSADPKQSDAWERCGNSTVWLLLATCPDCGPVRDFMCDPCFTGSDLFCGECHRPVTAIEAQAV